MKMHYISCCSIITVYTKHLCFVKLSFKPIIIYGCHFLSEGRQLSSLTAGRAQEGAPGSREKYWSPKMCFSIGKYVWTRPALHTRGHTLFSQIWVWYVFFVSTLWLSTMWCCCNLGFPCNQQWWDPPLAPGSSINIIKYNYVESTM